MNNTQNKAGQPHSILITGASSGIGQATAAYFAARDWQVFATMRKPSEAHPLAKVPGVTLLALDVTDPASIKQAIQTAISAHGHLDAIVNNAGYGALGAFELASEEQVRRQFETNVFGVMNVTKAILPHFRQRKAGTIINVASMGGRLAFPLYSLYHGTKWAIEGWSESMAYELRPFGIRVRIIEPGAIKTDFYDRSQDLLQNPDIMDYEAYTQKVIRNVEAAGGNAPGPDIVAKAIWKAANCTGGQLRYPVGNEAPALLILRRLIPDSWFAAIGRAVLEK